MTETALPFRYPWSWRVLDWADTMASLVPARSTTTLVPTLLLLPAIGLISLLVFGLGLVASDSLHVMDHATMLPRPGFSVENYATIAMRSHYRELMARSILSAIGVALLNVVLGFPYAYAMVRTKSALLRKALLACVFFPFLLGSVVRAYAWLVVLGRDGLINEIIGMFGVAPLSIIYTINAVVIGLVQFYLPLSILTIAPALTAIDESIDEAASSLGAGFLRTIWTVILPIAAPGLGGAFVLVLALVFSDMAVPGLLGGGRADFLTNAIFVSYMESGDRGVGAALCLVTTLICAGLILAFFGGRAWLAARARAQHV